MLSRAHSFGQRLLHVALLGGGLALSLGSSGTAKNKGHAQVTIVSPKCNFVKPASLEQSVKRYELSCRYNGGTPSFTFTKAPRAKGISCSRGTFLHSVVVSCTGAQFDKKLMQFKKTAATKLPTTPAEKAAMARVMLEEHNKYRTELSLQPLIWSGRLAELAQQYAQHLASLGGTRLVHSDPKSTGQGENLWRGTAGGYSFAEMIRIWGNEKSNFQNGTYDGTRQWTLVSHYTQMIWRSTKQVGCALARAGDYDILVCRYWPPGNVIGKKPY